MKKLNSFFVLLVVGFGFLCQSFQINASGYGGGIARAYNETMQGLLAIGLIIAIPSSILPIGGYYLITSLLESSAELDKSRAEEEKKIKQDNKRAQELEKDFLRKYAKNIEMYKDESSFNKTDFPTKIEDRINALINQKYTNEGGESFEIFSTPQLKIFVLKNIQDFFEFQKGLEFKVFNLIVYDVCVKKIRQLQTEFDGMDKKTDAYRKMIEIDKFRDEYMAEPSKERVKGLGISVSTLQKMSPSELNKKIEDVNAAFYKFLKRLYENKQPIDGTADAEFRALWSIFVHLSYKQSQKQLMFVGQELIDVPAQEKKDLEVKRMAQQAAKGLEQIEVSPGVWQRRIKAIIMSPKDEQVQAMTAKLGIKKSISREEGIRQVRESLTKEGKIPKLLYTDEELPQARAAMTAHEKMPKDFTEQELPQTEQELPQNQPRQEGFLAKARARFWRLLGWQ